MQTIITFPFVYPSLNRLLKMHPLEYHRIRKSYEKGFVVGINLAKPPKFKGPVKIRVILYFTKPRRRDLGNYEPKWLIDCLVKAGIIIDDSKKYLPERPSVAIVDDAHKEQTLVIIEEIKKKGEKDKK